MSQYYQLSWEDIYRLYPNIQVDNIDSVQYMVQDDKIIQKTGGQTERRPNCQMELQNESQSCFISQEIVQQNHVPRSVQEIVQETEFCNIVNTTETTTSTNACSEPLKEEEINKTSGQSPQINRLIQIENSETDNSSKTTPETSLQLEKTGPTLISMQSPVSTSNLQPYKRITLKQNQSDSYPTGVLIIPSGDNQTCVGQFPTGFRLQGTQTLSNTVMKQSGGDSKTKFNDKGSQTGDLSSHNIVVQQESSVLLFPTPSDSQKSSTLTGLNQHRIPVKTHIKSGSLEPTIVKPGEIMITSRVPQSSVNRIPTLLVLTPEQTSEPLVKEGERREIIVQPCGPGYVTQSATIQSPNPSQTSLKIAKGAGRGSRVGLTSPNQKLVLPTSPTVHGVPSITDRLIQAEVVNPGKKSKVVSSVGASGWTSSPQDLRNQVGPRPVIYQLASINNSNLASNNSLITTNNISAVNSTANVYINNSCNNVNNSDGNQCPENADETRMLVLLPNGEKKLVRFPNTQQNIQIQQLWQQVRFSLGSQISLVSNEQLADKTSISQLTKGVTLENQEPQPVQDNSSIIQISSSGIHNPGKVQSSPSVVAQQQRPRGVSPRPGNNATGNNAFRSRTQGNIPRMPSPRTVNQRMATPQQQQTQTLVTQTNTLSGMVTQVQPVKDAVTPPQQPKEVPKFIPGQVAICPFCGISSLDFNKCIRCRRKLPPNVKSQSIFTSKKKGPEESKSQEKEALEREQSEESSSDSSIDESSGTDTKDKSSSSAKNKKKSKPSPKKKKYAEEPTEIFILSSDEEEESSSSKVGPAIDLPVSFKEPVYQSVQLTEEEMSAIAKEPMLASDLMENALNGSYTTFLCRAVRIGSYKTQLRERLFLSPKGIRFVVPNLKSDYVAIIIPRSEIVKVLVNLGDQMPIIFVYTTSQMGYRIRLLLGMKSKTGPYFDPTAQKEETHKRITFLLEKVTEDNRVVTENIFPQEKLLEQISEKEANEILVRASAVEERPVAAVKPTDAVKKIMIFPPPPEKGGIPLNNQDYACLGEDQFLNDVIIDFYLKYLWLKVLSPEDRERTHIFSTFFYKRLTTKPKTIRKGDPENDPKLLPSEKRHLRVKGWTKHVNLFEKDFIIVPINEHAHWFLAIICFPGLKGPVRFSDNSPVEMEEIQPKKSARSIQIGNTTITHIVKREKNVVDSETDTGSDRDEAEGDQDDMNGSSEEEENEQVEEDAQSNSNQETPLLPSSQQSLQSPAVQSKELKPKPARRKPFKDPIKQPCILIFDSLAGASRARVVATLRDYLKVEYKTKIGLEREFSKETIKGAVPKVPQQTNFTDCGLYVLQYVESFFRSPLHTFKLPLKYLQNWFPEEVVASKRRELASLIRSLMVEQGINIDEIGLPNLTFASESNANGGIPEERKIRFGNFKDDGKEESENEDDKETIKAPSDFGEDVENLDVDEKGEEDSEDMDEDEKSVGRLQMENHSTPSIKDGCISVHAGSDSSKEGYMGVLKSQTVGPGVLVKYVDIAKVKKSIDDIPRGEIKAVEKKYEIRNQEETKEQKKTVPLTENQDFESQITVSTIEKINRLTPTQDIIFNSDVDEDEDDNNYERSCIIGRADEEDDENDDTASGDDIDEDEDEDEDHGIGNRGGDDEDFENEDEDVEGDGDCEGADVDVDSDSDSDEDNNDEVEVDQQEVMEDGEEPSTENSVLEESIGNMEYVDEEDDEDEVVEQDQFSIRSALATKKNIVGMDTITKFSTEKNGADLGNQSEVTENDSKAKGNFLNFEERENSQKLNSLCLKRSSESLKSVRIPKKSDKDVVLIKKPKIENNQ